METQYRTQAIDAEILETNSRELEDDLALNLNAIRS